MFHADEVLAIASFKFFTGLELPVERKFEVSLDELKGKSILVFDIGRRYDPDFGNFDHHQNPELDATNKLVLLEFCNQSSDLRIMLEKALFNIVSDVDRGVVTSGGPDGGFNAIIKQFNSIENGFEIAVQTALAILKGYVESAKKALEDRAKWKELRKEGRIAFMGSEPILGWKEYAEKEGIFLAISPNVRGGFQIVSYNSEKLQVPEKETQTFRHSSGFMAVYNTEEQAIAHAKEIIHNFFCEAKVEVYFEEGKQAKCLWNGRKIAAKFHETVNTKVIDRYKEMHTFEGDIEGSTWDKTEHYKETLLASFVKVEEEVVGIKPLNGFDVSVEGLQFWLKPFEINLAKVEIKGDTKKIVHYHDNGTFEA